uniref:Ubiquitin-like domain-containing protein n=1 Tax=Meloidogyne floridensis TaxID=298350 RepID=A0A915PFZ8_9BILA
MHVTIRDVNNNDYTFEVKDTDNIKTLKAMLEFKVGIPADGHRLVCCIYFLKIYRGKMLADEGKLCDYKIMHKSMIYMDVIQQRSDHFDLVYDILEYEKEKKKKREEKKRENARARSLSPPKCRRVHFADDYHYVGGPRFVTSSDEDGEKLNL